MAYGHTGLRITAVSCYLVITWTIVVIVLKCCSVSVIDCVVTACVFFVVAIAAVFFCVAFVVVIAVLSLFCYCCRCTHFSRLLLHRGSSVYERSYGLARAYKTLCNTHSGLGEIPLYEKYLLVRNTFRRQVSGLREVE